MPDFSFLWGFQLSCLSIKRSLKIGFESKWLVLGSHWPQKTWLGFDRSSEFWIELRASFISSIWASYSACWMENWDEILSWNDKIWIPGVNCYCETEEDPSSLPGVKEAEASSDASSFSSFWKLLGLPANEKNEEIFWTGGGRPPWKRICPDRRLFQSVRPGYLEAKEGGAGMGSGKCDALATPRMRRTSHWSISSSVYGWILHFLLVCSSNSR